MGHWMAKLDRFFHALLRQYREGTKAKDIGAGSAVSKIGVGG